MNEKNIPIIEYTICILIFNYIGYYFAGITAIYSIVMSFRLRRTIINNIFKYIVRFLIDFVLFVLFMRKSLLVSHKASFLCFDVNVCFSNRLFLSFSSFSYHFIYLIILHDFTFFCVNGAPFR